LDTLFVRLGDRRSLKKSLALFGREFALTILTTRFRITHHFHFVVTHSLLPATMTDLYFVTVDTRGRSSSDIHGYQECVSSFQYFRKNIAGNPDIVRYKCKVAKLCGLDMKIYFQNDKVSTVNDGSDTVVERGMNRAASLLTLDPATGFAEHHIRGAAYVVLDDGVAQLSTNQVWGIQELINYARDIYKSDSEHRIRGQKELLKSCKLYRHKEWGPLSIYQTRPQLAPTVATQSAATTKDSNRSSFQEIQA
jgi:hypothetical protein